MSSAENLSREQMVQTIDFLMARVSPDVRAKFMAHLPQAYNTLCGREIVRVVNVAGDEHRTVQFTETACVDGRFVQVVPALLGGL